MEAPKDLRMAMTKVILLSAAVSSSAKFCNDGAGMAGGGRESGYSCVGTPTL